MKTDREFPNGFTNWIETYHEIVKYIALKLHYDETDEAGSHILSRYSEGGTGATYEIAEEWTDEFEQNNKGRFWDGEFFDEIDEFCDFKNYIDNAKNV